MWCPHESLDTPKGGGNPSANGVRQEVPIGKPHCQPIGKRDSASLAVHPTESAIVIIKKELTVGN